MVVYVAVSGFWQLHVVDDNLMGCYWWIVVDTVNFVGDGLGFEWYYLLVVLEADRVVGSLGLEVDIFVFVGFYLLVYCCCWMWLHWLVVCFMYL